MTDVSDVAPRFPAVHPASGPSGRTVLKWLPPLCLPAMVALLGPNLPAWLLMWLMALALLIGAKWITIFPLLFATTQQRVSKARLLCYTFLWPGLNTRTFCAGKSAQVPVSPEWASAAVNTLVGVAMVWVVVPQLAPTHPLLVGWAGMIGLVLLLHFGLFDLLSLLWRSAGIDARPIMRSPATATCLRDFWGCRWNTAFSDLMHGGFLKSLARRLGAGPALFIVFVISGFLHELVISFPAHGGYGLPTAYFLLQGAGVLFERSRPGRRLGLGVGLRGWCFVLLVAGLPAYWLFNPTFIHHVILPMFWEYRHNLSLP